MATVVSALTETTRDRGESGAYQLNILNTLGRQQKQARNKLYSMAIMKPEEYLLRRSAAEEAVIDGAVSVLYANFKSLLLTGQDVDGNQIFVYPDDTAYEPRLPEATITKFAIRASETVEKIWEEAIEEVFPMKYGDLANKKSAELTRATHDSV